jgi:hypothetical protein
LPSATLVEPRSEAIASLIATRPAGPWIPLQTLCWVTTERDDRKGRQGALDDGAGRCRAAAMSTRGLTLLKLKGGWVECGADRSDDIAARARTTIEARQMSRYVGDESGLGARVCAPSMARTALLGHPCFHAERTKQRPSTSITRRAQRRRLFPALPRCLVGAGRGTELGTSFRGVPRSR